MLYLKARAGIEVLATYEGEKGQWLKTFAISDKRNKNGFPVVKIIEYGRRSFFLKPKQNRPRASLSFIKTCVRYFLKDHQIPERDAEKIIQDTIIKARLRVQKRMRRRWQH